MYDQDYDERLPSTAVNAIANVTSSNPYGWADALQPYLRSTQIFQCPSETNSANSTVNAGTGTAPDPTALGYTDYYYNGNLSQVSDASFNSPAETIMLGDGNTADSRYTYDGCVYTALSGSPSGTACSTGGAQSYITNMTGAGRHLDGGNYAFADGHVKWLKGSIITGTTINGSSSVGNSLYTTTLDTTGEATFSYN